MFTEKEFIDTYIYVYKQVYKSKSYSITGLKKQQYIESIKKFKQTLSKHINLNSLGKDWVFNYIVFQFFRLKDVSFNRFDGENNRVIFPDMIRKKSLEYYLTHQLNLPMMFYFDQFMIDHCIYVSEINKGKKEKKDKIIIDRLNDIERYRFLNTDDGLQHCKDRIISFNKKSKVCKECIFKKQCNE